MPLITVNTEIKAPIQRVFDLARSIDLHAVSMQHTGERAVAGKISGLVESGDWVEWRARHFGVWQRLSSRITEFKAPEYFTDEMVKGAFHSFKHRHVFLQTEYGTLMTDHFDYTAPLGSLGRLADILFLKKYMLRFLIERNRSIKEFAESERWRDIISG